MNAMFPETEDLLLHVAAQEERETAALFLLHHGAHTSVFNKQGLAPLHIAAGTGLVKLTTALLEKSASPNLRTKVRIILRNNYFNLISLYSSHRYLG